ncbi:MULTISPECIES: hypothetical protein [Methanosarcina]|uniref:hypothetical protein n=1 Tax=Methanosarcina TaxID=2207 RepID=UPI000A4C6A9A|nr:MULTISPECIES: hypothetical protein [Methanosarcina]
MNIKVKLQDAVNALNYSSLSVSNKKEEETCAILGLPCRKVKKNSWQNYKVCKLSIV